MRARERSEALLLTLADGRGRKAKAARCARALIRRFAPPAPASQEKGWDCWTFRCEGKTGLATEPRSHKKLPGHRILSLMPDTHPEAIAPAPPRPLIGWRLLALFYDLWPSLALWMLASLFFTLGSPLAGPPPPPGQHPPHTGSQGLRGIPSALPRGLQRVPP